mmetsp:Transcript_17995/g.32030  ORF Transcript_17995/g.32030 Transcript_17995/m.32030 type:complete len:382 (-) Transcript_17995:19-1164(-)
MSQGSSRSATPSRVPTPRITAASGHFRKRDDLVHRPASPAVLDPIPDTEAGSAGSGGAASGETRRAPSSRRHLCHLAMWEMYFDKSEDLALEGRGGSFRVYTAGSSGPVVFCLHGGGYTGLTWALFAKRLKDHCRVVALDQRGHGSTATLNDEDLSAETLAADAVAVWQALFGEEKPATVLIGHSMGGAIATRAATQAQSQGTLPVDGVIVVDVVEGTALAALPAMMGILERRPSEFTSLEVAFEWALASGTTKNPEAASVSLPSQLTPPTEENPNLRWITPLEKSQCYWEGWYKGLSKEFLALTCPKVLMLAGTDRLDKDLTIGQMQGKYQLVLLPVAGHAIQEDEPESTAGAVKDFLKRYRVGQPPMSLPPGSWGAARP